MKLTQYLSQNSEDFFQPKWYPVVFHCPIRHYFSFWYFSWITFCCLYLVMTCVCMRRKGNINYHLVVMFIDYKQQKAPGKGNNIISRHEFRKQSEIWLKITQATFCGLFNDLIWECSNFFFLLKTYMKRCHSAYGELRENFQDFVCCLCLFYTCIEL